MEAIGDDFSKPLECSSSDSFELEENHQTHKVNELNVKDNSNIISSNVTTPERLVYDGSTSYDQSSDLLKSHTSIEENIAQFLAMAHNESSLNNDEAPSTDQMELKQKLFPSGENTSRKRNRDPQSWKRNKAAILRERGETYRSYSGKDIPKKIPNLGNLCNDSCPYKCNIKFSKEQREKLFADFYKLDVNSKNALLYNCISKVDVHRQKKDAKKHKSSTFFYMIKTESDTVRVCKTALAAIFSIGRGKIDHIQKMIKTGHSVPPLDGRGKHINRPHKITSDVVNYVEDHIRSCLCEELQHSGTKNIQQKYMSPLLSVKKMYDLYLDKVKSNNQPEKFKISEFTYRNIFSSNLNLSFGYPQSDTCEKDIDDAHTANYHTAFQMGKFDQELPIDLSINLKQTMPRP